MTWFAVSLTFLSDWHVGTGAGRVGAIDACVHRDRYGLPVVPAKTLTGVWRDACETVAHVLDGTSPDASITGPWSRWVTALFGSAENADWMPALLAIGPARLPDDVAAVLRAYPSLRDALFVRRPGVAIDPCTGTAQENHLRLEERVTCGLTLVTRAELLRVPPGTPLPEPAEFLLRAGARLVDALGGKRSRGAGRVALQMGPPAQLNEHGADARLLELLDRTAVLDAPGEPPALDDQVCDLAPGRLGSARRTVHRIALLAHTPVVIPDRLRGNLQTTHDRILGTAILPAVLQRIPEQLGLDDIRVTDAVPAVLVDGRYTPAHPAPLVWHRSDKGEGDAMLNVACTVPDPGSKAKPVRDRVVRVEGGRWATVRTGFADRTHAVIADRERRPVESAGGGLFTFLGIPPGTVMVTDVGLPAGVSPGLAPGGRLRLGRSRKDDFGDVEVLSVEELNSLPPEPTDSHPPEILTVWCLSDVMLRGPNLAPDPSPLGLARALGVALGTTLTVVRPDQGDDRRPTVTAAVRRNSFAVRWGRPRLCQVALAAGSAVTLRIDGPPVTAQARARVEREGVGERTAEGFGRVLFNLPELDSEQIPLVTEARPAQHLGDGQVPDTIPEALHEILRIAWRTVIRRRVEQLAAEHDLLNLLLPENPPIPEGSPTTAGAGATPVARRRPRPTANQLGQLRAQLKQLGQPDQVRHWFTGLRDSKNRSRSWSDYALDAAEVLLLDTLPPTRSGWTTPPPTVWQHLGLDTGEQLAEADLPPGSASLRTELAVEARTLLIVAMHRQLRSGRGRPSDQEEPADEARATAVEGGAR